MPKEPKNPTQQASPRSSKRRRLAISAGTSSSAAETNSPRLSLVVAIGASAGGLEALEKFFDYVPEDSGAAWVVIQHLDPNFRSVMDELLARHSRLPIRKIENGMTIEPNAIYLNPPRHDMKVEGGRFTMQPSERSGGLNLPINAFFESAAGEFTEHAVGVILSGTGSDGTKGCEAIKQCGGRVFVQEPSSTKFDSMPASVLAKGLADGVDIPEALPGLILQEMSGAPSSAVSALEDVDPSAAIFSMIRARYEIDFNVYKPGTMERRIKRRMNLVGSHSVMDYADRLAVNRDELANLVKDLLVDVTAFFRDGGAFSALKEKVIAPLVDKMEDDREIRVWIAGCSSGEEAYSVAIAFAEQAAAISKTLNLKILATDIHLTSLTAASAGIYAPEVVAGLPADIVERYFDAEADNFRVKKALRRLIVFSQHNLLKDPPFARIDLLCCRNVLIYFNDEAQRFALSLFHFALVKGGYIFLGPSEALGGLADEFKVIHAKWRLFAKTRDARLLGASGLTLRVGGPSRGLLKNTLDAAMFSGATPPASRDVMRATSGALKELLARYAPPGFLIGRDGALLHVFGDAAKFINLRPGVFSQRILDLLPREIALVVANGLATLLSAPATKFRRSIRAQTGEGEKIEVVTLEPLSNADSDAEYLLLTIEEIDAAPRTDAAKAKDSVAAIDDALELRRRNEELVADLQSTEENLQSAIEELATSNEELQSTNEELMASNEELQSTNEELHSVNEELYTVTAEHQRKIDELVQLTLDMEHLLKATEIGTIFLDERLFVRRFTPAAAHAFNLIAQDVGRPISHITLRFEGVDFLALLDEVIRIGAMREREVTVAGQVYLLRILPYRADGAEPKGAVVTLIDINAVKVAQARLRVLDKRNEAVLSALSESILCWDAATETILFCNEMFAQTVETPIDEILGRGLRAVMGADFYAHPKQAMEDLRHSKVIERTVRHVKKSGAVLFRSVLFTRIDDEQGRPTAYLSCARDITENYRYTRALEELSTYEPAVDEPVETLCKYALEIGARLLGTPYGLFSEVEGDHHRIVRIVGPMRQALVAGAEINLPQDLCAGGCVTTGAGLCLFKDPTGSGLPGASPAGTPGSGEAVDGALCDFVLEGARLVTRGEGADPVLSINDGRTLRQYIGAEVRAAGHVCGTLSFFTDAEPEFGPFSDLQRGFVRQLAQWIGMRIEAHRQHLVLLRSENKLRLMFDSVPHAIWRIDGARRIQRLNTAAAALMQRPANQILGQSIDEILPTLDAHWRAHDAEVARTRQPLLGVMQEGVGTDGRRRWISTDRIPYIDDSGELAQLIVASDVTSLKEREAELKSANLELQRSRDRFDQLYRHTPAMMCQLSRQGVLREISDLWRQKTGYERREAVGQPLANSLEAESAKRLNEELLAAIWRDGYCGSTPLNVVAKSGRLIEVELWGFLNTVEETDSYCLAVLVDVTARKDAERALEQANRELATANDGLKKFAHVASHDLQEPLRKISQFGDLLASEYVDKLGEEGGRLIKVIRDSAERMRRLVRDILAFSKSVNTTLVKSELPLADLIRELIGELEMTVRETGVRINVATLPNVMGDRTAVQLMLRNLISNGIKYRKPDVAPVIDIEGGFTDDGRYAIRVRDNGRGFDPRYSEIVFDPFTRLHNRSDVDGSGIGLALCKSVCERQHWAITANSAEAVGSEFAILIPTSDIVDYAKGAAIHAGANADDLHDRR